MNRDNMSNSMHQNQTQHFTISANGFYGDLVTPKKTIYPGKAIIVLGGGGVPYQLTLDETYAFADMGIVALGVGYFNVPEAPACLCEIPIEYVENAVTYLKKEGYDKVLVTGISKGAELALVSASMIADIKGVIAISPASKVYMGLGKSISWKNCSSWTYKGKSLPYAYTKVNRWGVYFKALIKGEPTFYSIYDKADISARDCEIECEKISGPILFVSADYDSMWPSKANSEIMISRLNEKRFPYSYKHLNYKYASHLILPFHSSYGKLFKMTRKHPKECNETVNQLVEEIKNWLYSV